jgi:hypothetical protein
MEMHMEKMNAVEFKRRAELVNEGRYNLSHTNFVSSKTKVRVICNSCGEEIEIEPVKLLAGIGCKKCYGVTYLNAQKFIERSKAIYGEDAFDYSEVEYKNFHHKVKITCNKCHMSFLRKPSVHLQDCECPFCHASEGEKKIWKFLSDYGICFDKEKSFSDLGDKGLLRFDFYLPEHKTAIEYNDLTHYESSYANTLKGKRDFLNKKHRDELKVEYARENGIKLITIPYTALDRIEDILRATLELSEQPIQRQLKEHQPSQYDETRLKTEALNYASYIWGQLQGHTEQERDFILDQMNSILNQLR